MLVLDVSVCLSNTEIQIFLCIKKVLNAFTITIRATFCLYAVVLHGW